MAADIQAQAPRRIPREVGLQGPESLTEAVRRADI